MKELNEIEKDIQPADLYALQKNSEENCLAELIRIHGHPARAMLLALSDLLGPGGGRIWIPARSSLERGAKIRSMEKANSKG